MTQTLCLVALLAACATVTSAGVRAKRQLSPAVQLENLVGAYGYGPFQQEKRGMLPLKRHISPSFDVEEDVGNMRTLMDIGKRQVSAVDDMGKQFQMYNRLFDAGKKRSFSPTSDLQESVDISNFLERAGRK